MEAQTDLETYLERGKQALAQGQAREAAIAYAHGAQMEPNNPMVHLGLAEANLALGNYGVVQMACSRVQELQPSGGIEATTAQALLNALDHRYERALQDINNVISEDPGIAYAHALRSYLLRTQGQDYDANLARARAARLSYGGRFNDDFPPIEPGIAASYQGYAPTSAPQDPQAPEGTINGNGAARAERESVPTWSRPNQMQRQIIRTRFTLGQYPGLVTNILIAVNVIIYGLSVIFPSINEYGAQANNLVLQGEYWRIFTAMFLHASIFHVGLNMLSLFFIGRVVEIMYGKWRYLVIYLLAGIFGGVSFLFLSPGEVAVGASGAIFGVFGALGVFYIVNRRAMGSFGSGISNWIFWLVLNLVLGITQGSNIAIWAHMGGLVAGMIIAFILIPRQNRRRTI